MSHTKTRTREERYLDALDQAIEYGEDVKENNPSREVAVSVTELETARLWAYRDMEQKVQNTSN